MSGATNNLKNYEGRIIRDKGICGGEPVFKGTRVTLRTFSRAWLTGIPSKRFSPISRA
jgi:uncharacterized protein (DUF433 family)